MPGPIQRRSCGLCLRLSVLVGVVEARGRVAGEGDLGNHRFEIFFILQHSTQRCSLLSSAACPLRLGAFTGAVLSTEVLEASRANWFSGRLGSQGTSSMASKLDVCTKQKHGLFFSRGVLEFWLEKSKGRVCKALSSKALVSKVLVITRIDDRRYWVHMPTIESRFHSVAYLQQILWFEVVGEFDFCFPVGTYSLYFRLHLGKASKCFGRRVCSSEHIHGWDKKPVRFQLSTSDGQLALSQCYLDEPGSWILYHVSDFVASKPEQPIKLKFSVAQIDCTHTKGGLCVDSVLIYPKGFQQEKVARAQK